MVVLSLTDHANGAPCWPLPLSCDFGGIIGQPLLAGSFVFAAAAAAPREGPHSSALSAAFCKTSKALRLAAARDRRFFEFGRFLLPSPATVVPPPPSSVPDSAASSVVGGAAAATFLLASPACAYTGRSVFTRQCRSFQEEDVRCLSVHDFCQSHRLEKIGTMSIETTREDLCRTSLQSCCVPKDCKDVRQRGTEKNVPAVAQTQVL